MTIRRRIAALAAVLALAGTLVFPSGAAPLLAGPTDSIGHDVALAPSSDYAYLDDGELVVDISPSNPEIEADGINPDSIVTFDDVFRVQYTGSEYADVWLTHDSAAVTFSVDGEPVESEANSVTLAPNESLAVGLVVDTRGETADGVIDDVTIHAKVADDEHVAASDGPGVEVSDGPSIEFSGPTVQSRAPTPDSRRYVVLGASPGDVYRFDASALVLDRADSSALTLDELVVGNADGSLSLAADAVAGESSRALVADEGAEPLGAAGVSVETGAIENATLRFSAPQSYLDARDVTAENVSVYRDSDGELSELDVSVTGERDGRVYFEAETPGFSTFVVSADRARLRVADATLDRSTVPAGESVDVTATVVNDGTSSGERTVAVSVDGAVVAERAVSMAPGESTSVTIPVSQTDPGEYDVAVDGLDAGTVVVEAASEPVDESSDQSASDETPSGDVSESENLVEEPAGFGLSELLGLVTLLGLLAALLFLARRASWQ